MSAIKLAILGAGNLQYAIPVIASLATYFGERPLEIAFYDADEERLDLFDRFARLCFVMMEATHTLSSSTDFREALADAQFVVAQVGINCARREMDARFEAAADEVHRDAMQRMKEWVPAHAHLLGLEGTFDEWPQSVSYVPTWPEEKHPDDGFAVQLQILRWLNGEEYPFDMFKQQEKSPVKQWLDNPMSLPVQAN